jgi:hypothetical protein
MFLPHQLHPPFLNTKYSLPLHSVNIFASINLSSPIMQIQIPLAPLATLAVAYNPILYDRDIEDDGDLFAREAGPAPCFHARDATAPYLQARGLIRRQRKPKGRK